MGQDRTDADDAVTDATDGADGPSCQWPQLRASTRNTAYVPTGHVPTGPVDLAWQFETDALVEGGPVVAHDRVYGTARDGTLYALDAEDGTETWSVDIGSNCFTTPAICHRTAVATTAGGTVHAFDAETGQPRWSYDTDTDRPGTPVVGRRVLVASDGDLHVLDRRNGDVHAQWTLPGVVAGTPALADGVATVATADGTVLALDVLEGEELWRIDLEAPPVSGPQLAGERCYVVLERAAAEVVAVDASSATVLWRRNLDVRRVAPPVLAEDVLVVAHRGARPGAGATDGARGTSGGLLAVDSSDGTVQWRTSGPAYDVLPDGEGGPVGRNGILFAPFANDVHAFSLDEGRHLWEAMGGFPTIEAVVPSRGRLYARHGLSSLFALDVPSDTTGDRS